MRRVLAPFIKPHQCSINNCQGVFGALAVSSHRISLVLSSPARDSVEFVWQRYCLYYGALATSLLSNSHLPKYRASRPGNKQATHSHKRWESRVVELHAEGKGYWILARETGILRDAARGITKYRSEVSEFNLPPRAEKKLASEG